MTKRILAVLVVLLLAGTVGLLAGCGGDLPNGAVAKVGANVITQKEFDEQLTIFEAVYRNYVPDKQTDPEGYKSFEQFVVENMIAHELALQKAASLGFSVTDADVQSEIDSIVNASFNGDQAAFDKALVDEGLTTDLFKIYIRESLELQKAKEAVTKDVTTVPDSDIQAYYDANKTDYFVDETRTARHILIAPVAGRADGTTSTTSTSSTTSTTAGSSTDSSDSSTTTAASTSTASSSTTTTAAPREADWNSALETAQKVRADLVGGADWTTEAAKYSDDPGSKAKGGDLGTISKGDMVKEFEDAVFSLKQDEISQPVKTAYGYHVIQVTGITPAKQYTLDEVKDEIKASLVSTKQTETWLNWIDAQKKAVGVTYADEWTPSTTTTTAPTPTTSGPADTTTTVAPSAQTTVAPSSTTTTAGATITTAAPTTTTAKP